MSGLLYCKNILMWYNKYRKTTAHKVGCQFKGSEKSASVNSKLQRRFFYVHFTFCS